MLGEYSHVEIVTPDNWLISCEPFKGVCYLKLEERVQQASHYEMFCVDAPASVITRADSQIGKPYDLVGAIGLGLQRDWSAQHKWWCSEHVAWSFQMEGVPLVNPEVKYNRISPDDLLLSPLLKSIKI